MTELSTRSPSTSKPEPVTTGTMTARLVGILFITATVASIVAVLVLDPILSASDFLTRASVDSAQVGTGAIFEAINHLAVIGIAVAIYPVLRRFNDRLAMGYVAIRVTESVLLFATTTRLLELVSVSDRFVDDGSPTDGGYQTLGDTLLAGHDWDQAHLAFIVFSLGALLLNSVLYQTRLVPRWLSIAGLVAAAIHLLGAVSGVYGAVASSSIELVINMPIMVQEMVFAVWLIAKGFDPSVFLAPSEPVVEHQT